MGKGNPFGSIPGMGNMMKQVQKMVEDQQKMEQELAEVRVETSAGGGMVKAIINGKSELLEVKIDPQVVDPEDVEMLQDLIVSAVREALEKVQDIREERVKAITGGLNIPGMPGMF
ncbi:MAG: YbaB/EbfC family nucleoid-associated protein [Armatimonadetes bacterium]|nr:YbaB/EbfC family nucleoid-associated protein [Armatimonadota bacterium]